ncbi:COG4280 domain-containing protein [Demequina lutea]|uniref:Putative membrane protein n=1 Tax=Demequina lutea TaxID=431489 RepID=A0A7Y9Z720_9MICO|nr:TMEM165/GDT1 family protein [Demequina lutea]NYI39997.1 putative membrane protein [Demequina lutea]
MSDISLFVAVFLACLVEAVEATTIVLAAGTARHWRSAMLGTLAGLAVLVVAIAVAGPAISHLPLGALRLLVGGLLLVFGLQWMRKAILRASGYKALHDEAAIYKKEVAAAAQAEQGSRRGVKDWYAFTLSFKGVVLEGLEVVFIVLTFGTNQKNLPVAAVAAATAVVIVVILGAVVRGPLSRVPENTLKFVVGVMLTAFGIFWGAEGAGADWPGSDTSLLVIAPAVAIFGLALAVGMRRFRVSRVPAPELIPVGARVGEGSVALTQTTLAQMNLAQMNLAQMNLAQEIAGAAEDAQAAEPAAHVRAVAVATETPQRGLESRLRAFGAFWYDFIIGDDWQVAAGVALGLLMVFVVSSASSLAWIVMPVAIAVLLPYGVRRAMR